MTICKVPLCSCPEFKKGGSQLLCNTIIFVLLYILQLKDEFHLWNTWIGDHDLKSVISSAPTNIPMLFNKPEVHKRTLLECQRMLQSDIRYNNEQSVILHNKQKQLHCMESVQIGSFFWSVFSRIRTEYGEIRSMLSISPYSAWMRGNTDQKKLHIWTLFKQQLANFNGCKSTIYNGVFKDVFSYFHDANKKGLLILILWYFQIDVKLLKSWMFPVDVLHHKPLHFFIDDFRIQM